MLYILSSILNSQSILLTVIYFEERTKKYIRSAILARIVKYYQIMFPKHLLWGADEAISEYTRSDGSLEWMFVIASDPWELAKSSLASATMSRHDIKISNLSLLLQDDCHRRLLHYKTPANSSPALCCLWLTGWVSSW